VPAEQTFTHPAEDGSGDNIHDLTLATTGTYTFQVDAEPDDYHRVDWYTTKYGGTPKTTAYLTYYDNENFTFSSYGNYWVRAEVYKSDFLNNPDGDWEAVYRWNITVPEPPELQIDTTSVDFGSSSTSRTFRVTNSGGGTLSYSISDNQSNPNWLWVSPTSGSSTGEYDTINVYVLSPGLSEPGTESLSQDS
jgi:hypothetical protein